MGRSTNYLLHAIKDHLRSVRYTIRTEVETPGAALPKAVGALDLTPFIAVGSAVGTPALRVVDGLLTHVESLATEVISPKTDGRAQYPVEIAAYFSRKASFSDRLFEPYKRLLQINGVRNVLLSEQALGLAEDRFYARYGDLPGAGSEETRKRWAIQVCAGLVCALAEARPIRKVDYNRTTASGAPFMLDPNLYCAAAIGLETAIVTQHPLLLEEPDSVQDSVTSVINARFDRMKQAMSSKSPATELAALFEAVLPYLP